MPSSLTWLDSSESERRKVLEVVELFRDQGTVDELGIGAIRDGFADLFFPGTSTLLTRAGYLLFVPWIYQEVERSAAKSRDPWRSVRQLEVALIDALAESEDGAGTIGINGCRGTGGCRTCRAAPSSTGPVLVGTSRTATPGPAVSSMPR